jgi:hypothetical protein
LCLGGKPVYFFRRPILKSCNRAPLDCALCIKPSPVKTGFVARMQFDTLS